MEILGLYFAMAVAPAISHLLRNVIRWRVIRAMIAVAGSVGVYVLLNVLSQIMRFGQLLDTGIYTADILGIVAVFAATGVVLNYFLGKFIRSRTTRACIIIIGAMAFCDVMLVDTIPPGALTRGRMNGVEQRIRAYAQVHHHMPATLADLPKRENYDDSDVDGRGKPLVYTPQTDGSVVITSFGKPGSNQPISLRFTIDGVGEGSR